MTIALFAFAAALVLVALGIQVYYLRGLARAGVEVTPATKWVTYFNIGLLSLIALGLLVYGVIGQLVSIGM